MSDTRYAHPDTCGSRFISCSRDVVGTRHYMAFPMFCHSWDCKPCRSRKARAYKETIKSFLGRQRLWMLTLTYYHSVPPAQAWAEYNNAWNRFRTSLTKAFGKFSYVRILEPHNDSDYPHLHVLVSKPFPLRRFFKLAGLAGFGYQLSQLEITGERGAFYVSKYLTKEWKNVNANKYRRRYRCRLISFTFDIRVAKPPREHWQIGCSGDTLAGVVGCIKQDIEWEYGQSKVIHHEERTDIFYRLTILTG
jgi:hypothetical protein